MAARQREPARGHQLECVGKQLVRLAALQPTPVGVDLRENRRRAVRAAVNLDA